MSYFDIHIACSLLYLVYIFLRYNYGEYIHEITDYMASSNEETDYTPTKYKPIKILRHLPFVVIFPYIGVISLILMTVAFFLFLTFPDDE